MDSYNSNEKREIIMNYYLNPKRKKNDDFDIVNLESHYLHSINCVDEITLIKLKDKNDYCYKAIGCAVFLASSDIFLEEASKNNFNNIQELSNNYQKLVNQQEMSEEEFISIGKLCVFSNVKKHLNRVECALIITKVFEKFEIQ